MARIKVKTVPLVFSQEGDPSLDAIMGSCICKGGRRVLRGGEAANMTLIGDWFEVKDFTPEQLLQIGASMDELWRLGKAALGIRTKVENSFR